TDAGWIMYLVTATVGAVVLLGIVNLVQRGRVR
ncbi:MAG: GlsB/YeaQ/YmgE family stress response membrane protein, partial [Sphingomonadales bacterium]